jgi:hypothetical protein
MSAFEFQLFDPSLRKLQFQTRNGETRVGEHPTSKIFGIYISPSTKQLLLWPLSPT